MCSYVCNEGSSTSFSFWRFCVVGSFYCDLFLRYSYFIRIKSSIWSRGLYKGDTSWFWVPCGNSTSTNYTIAITRFTMSSCNIHLIYWLFFLGRATKKGFCGILYTIYFIFSPAGTKRGIVLYITPIRSLWTAQNPIIYYPTMQDKWCCCWSVVVDVRERRLSENYYYSTWSSYFLL